MPEHQLPGGILYTGTPADVLMAVSARIAKVLEQANIAPTGIHVLALLHVASCAFRNGRQDYNTGDASMGAMPSFKTVLTFLTRISMGEMLNKEETQAFDEDFVAIVKSLGGSIEQSSTTNTFSNSMTLAPMSKEVH